MIDAADACYVQYVPSSNSMYLENNAGNGTSAALIPGSTGSVSNSQCTLAGAGTTVSLSGNDMTVSYAITFSGTFTGEKNVYLLAGSNMGSSGWLTEGTWTPAAAGPPPTIVSLTPNSGAGTAETFTAVYSDPRGASTLQTARFLMSTGIHPADGCYVLYVPSSNLMYLEDDDGNGTSPGLTPGAGSVSNSQCTLSGAGTAVTSSANDLTITFALSFTGTFTGSKNVYLLAADTTGNTDWVREGTWTP